jgi:hypothetical protein
MRYQEARASLALKGDGFLCAKIQPIIQPAAIEVAVVRPP